MTTTPTRTAHRRGLLALVLIFSSGGLLRLVFGG